MKCLVTTKAVVSVSLSTPAIEDFRETRQLFCIFDKDIYFKKDFDFVKQVNDILNMFIGAPITKDIIERVQYKIQNILNYEYQLGHIFHIDQIFGDKDQYNYIPHTRFFKELEKASK